MCCCCIPSSRGGSSDSERRKRATLNIYSFLLLPLCIAFLVSSVFAGSPWFRLILRPSAPSPSPPMLAASPLAFSAPSVWSLGGSASNLHAARHVAVGEAAQKPPEPLLISIWSLEDVTLIVPEFNLTRTLRIDKIPDDPILAAALSVGGVYRALVDATAANALIRSLTIWSIPFIALAFLLAAVFAFVDCFSPVLCPTPIPPPHPNGDTCVPAAAASSTVLVLPDPPHPWASLQVPLNPTRYKPPEGVGPAPVRRGPLILEGVLALVGAACLGLGFMIWVTKSVKDCQIVLEAITRFLGRRAVDWVTHHAVFEIAVGSVEYLAALGLLMAVSLMNLFTRIRDPAPPPPDPYWSAWSSSSSCYGIPVGAEQQYPQATGPSVTQTAYHQHNPLMAGGASSGGSTPHQQHHGTSSSSNGRQYVPPPLPV